MVVEFEGLGGRQCFRFSGVGAIGERPMRMNHVEGRKEEGLRFCVVVEYTTHTPM